MKEEWKWLMVTDEDIRLGFPDDCVRCPIALAMGRAIKKDDKLKDYRPHISGEYMFLEQRTTGISSFDDKPPISIEIFEPDIHIYKDFIWEFDRIAGGLDDDDDSETPGTIGFRYRIIDKKETK